MEEDLLINSIKSSIEMDLGGSRLCCSPRRNLSPIDHMEDELARDLSPANASHLGSISLSPFCHPNLGSALIPTLIPAPVPTPAPPLPFFNELFRQFIKAYLETNQGYKKPPINRKQSFKAKVPEVYYSKLHIDCYHFCQ